MLKDKDKDKGWFNRFIDDRRLVFYATAGLFVTGVLFIIIGIIVYFVSPLSKPDASQVVIKDENSKYYKYWKESDDQIQYEFQNIDSISDAGVTCSTVGPFVFTAKMTKASASFKGGVVDYQLTVTKNFNDVQSKPIVASTPINLLNQRYIELAQSKTSESDLLMAAFKNSTLVDDIQTYFETIGPKLIAARGIGQSFQDSVKTMRDSVIIPGLFSNLMESILDYPLQYQINGLNEKVCIGCAGISIKGMFSNIYTRWLTDSTCQNGVSPLNPDTFYPLFINGFPGSSDCITFLNTHKLDSTKWDAATDKTLAQTLLDSTKPATLNQWYDPTAPRSLGYCHNQGAAATAYSATLDQIANFCSLIDSMLNTIDTPTNIGEQAFCGSFNGIPMSFSKDVPADAVGTDYPSISLNYTTIFDLTTCNGYISALTDIPNFVIPLYNGISEDIIGHVFSPSELTMLLNYIKKFESTMKRWFVSAWRGGSTYTCPSCVISGLSNPTLFDGTTKEIIEFLFPELSEVFKDQKTQYSLFHSDPKPIGANSIFDDISNATGIINYQMDLSKGPAQSLFLFSDDQYNAILTYVDTLTNNYYAKLKTDYGLDASLTNQISTGYYQFASAKLACGPKGTGYCSIATAFYGVAPGVEDFEFGICSYVTTGTQIYYRSFTTADQSLRDTAKDTFINGLFSQLQSPEAMVGNDDPAQKYLFYLLSKYLYDSYFSTTSGLIATRPGAQWISGFTDNAIAFLKGDANISPSFGFDVDGTVASVELNTGATDIKKANTLSLFNGATSVYAYAQSEGIVDLVTIEGVPINVFIDGAKVKYFDMDLKRAFTFVVSDGEDVNNIPTKKGVVSSDDWKVNPVYGITTDYLMPNFLKDGSYLSPCTVSLNTQCAFPPAADRVHQIQIDPQTGFTMTFDNCVIQTLDLGMTYDFSSPNGTPENKLVSQVRKTTSRRVNPDMITDLSEYQQQQVNKSALAALVALVVIGSLFVIVGLVLIVFWAIRRPKKGLITSETSLVDDPPKKKIEKDKESNNPGSSLQKKKTGTKKETKSIESEPLQMDDLESIATKTFIVGEMTLMNTKFEISLPGFMNIDFVNQIRKEERIGGGGAAIIYKGVIVDPKLRERFGFKEVAIKQLVNDQNISEEESKLRFEQEISIIWAISSHPNTLTLVGYSENPPSIITKLYDEDLYNYIKKAKEDIPSEIILKFAKDIASGMSLVHSTRIAHRDLKSSNILLEKENGKMKAIICDFGLARISSEKNVLKQKMVNVKGLSPRYTAPEVFGRMLANTTEILIEDEMKSDVYSFALILWEMMARKIPWADLKETAEIDFQVRSGKREPIPDSKGDKILELLSTIIELSWNQIPNERPTFNQIDQKISSSV